MNLLLKYISSALVILMVLACTEESKTWTDPNPTNGPAPLITSVVPDSGFAGTDVTFTGENFSPVMANNMVLFGQNQGVIKSATATELVVQLPMVNDKTVLPKVGVHGSEFWGYWEGQTADTSGNMIDDSLSFTFFQALEALVDTVYWPAGVTTGPDSTIYFIANQATGGWKKGLHKITTDGIVELVKSSTVLGNLIYNTSTDSIWGSNLKRGKNYSWISSIPATGGSSFSRRIKNVTAPSSIDFVKETGDMFYTSLGYYEMEIEEIEDYFDTTITDILGGIYLEPMTGRAFSDTTLRMKVAEYSRPTSCKIMGDYLYVTQANQEEGAAISRNLITGETLGETEVVLDEFENIYCLEFDGEGNLYFVPEETSTLYQYNPSSGELVEFFPGDVVPTANYMAWDGVNLVLSFSNIADDFEVSSAEEPGMIQRVYTGATGYQQ